MNRSWLAGTQAEHLSFLPVMSILTSVHAAPGMRSALVAACALSVCAADVAIAQEISSLPALVVTATRQPTQLSAVLADVTVIERSEIERTGHGTIVDLLNRQPGIQLAANGGAGNAASLYVRGARSDQTKILIDGVAINSIDLSGSPLRYLSLGDVERIEIVRGPGAALYGADAISGVIQIFTKKPTDGDLKFDGFIGSGTEKTLKANAGVSGGNEQWRFRLQGDRDITGGFSSQPHASNLDADNDRYRNTGLSGSASFTPMKGHEVGLSYRRNEGIAYFDSGYGNGNFDNRVDFETQNLQVYLKNQLTDAWTSKVQYGVSRDDQLSYYEFENSLTKSENKQLSWQNDVQLPLGVGLVAVERHEQQAEPASEFTRNPKVANNSVLAGWTASMGRHDWQFNVRQDHHSAFGDHETYGLAYGYHLAQGLRAHFSYGTSFKAPSTYQLYSNYWGAGNPDLDPEEGRNRELGLTWSQGAHSASATYYLNHISNLISWGANGYENVAKARLEGVTLATKSQWMGWDMRAAYDWLNATNPETGKRLGRRARSRLVLSADRDWGRFNTGIEVVGASSRFDNDIESLKLGGYGLVNLTGAYHLNKAWRLEARVDNLLDKRYEQAKGYGMLGFNTFVGIRYTPQ